MLKPMVFANAFTSVWVGVYVVCWLVSVIAPELIFNLSKTWIHSVNLDAIRVNESLNFGPALIGAVTFGLFVWVVAYSGALLYNKWSK